MSREDTSDMEMNLHQRLVVVEEFVEDNPRHEHVDPLGVQVRQQLKQGYTENVDTQRLWIHRDCGYTETVDTQSMWIQRLWIHRDCGYTDTVDTQRLWMHRDCGYTQYVDTQGVWIQSLGIHSLDINNTGTQE